MDYKLAKALKKMEFPQRIACGDKFFDEKGRLGIWNEMEDLQFVYPNLQATKIPTLSQLIEACEKEPIFILELINPMLEFKSWHCTNGQKWGYGETPEESVANLCLKQLWLKLDINTQNDITKRIKTK